MGRRVAIEYLCGWDKKRIMLTTEFNFSSPLKNLNHMKTKTRPKFYFLRKGLSPASVLTEIQVVLGKWPFLWPGSTLGVMPGSECALLVLSWCPFASGSVGSL